MKSNDTLSFYIGDNFTYKDYMEKRFLPQYNYYNSASKKCRFKFILLSVLNLIFTTLVPVFSVVSDNITIKIIIAVLGALATICSGILLIGKHKKSWVRFRDTAERLVKEKALYLSKAEYYSNKNETQCFQTFVTNCEKIMENEHRD